MATLGDLHYWAKDCAEAATVREFQTTTWENLPGKLMFVVSELVEFEEAFEYLRAATTQARVDELLINMNEELADAAIRILSTMHDLFGSTWSRGRVENRRRLARVPAYTCDELLRPIRKHLVGALEFWRDDARSDVMIHLELALLNTFRAGDALGADMIEEIANKQAKNKARPPKHGRKQNLG